MKLPFLTPLVVLVVLAICASAPAANLQSATVTRVIKDVKIYRPGAASVTASVGNVIRGRTSLPTGRNSRSELRFQDDTLTRLGQNSVFSFQQGSRDLELNQGTILLQVPKQAGGARIRTATVTAAITGTTILMEYHKGKWAKVIVLEGDLNLFLNGVGRRVKVESGQMLVMRANATKVPQPVDVDLKRLQETSLLAGEKLFAPLPEKVLALISQTITQQGEMMQQGTLSNPSKNPGVNPTMSGQAPNAGAQVAQTTQSVADVVKAPVRQAKWYEYRPPPQ